MRSSNSGGRDVLSFVRSGTTFGALYSTLKNKKHKGIYKKWWFWVLTAVVALFIAIMAQPYESSYHEPRENANEIVDSNHNITVGDLQDLAAGGLVSIDIQYGMNNAQSINDISYSITESGGVLVVITCSSSSGNVAFFATLPTSEYAEQFAGGYQSYNPAVYFGLYTGSTLAAEPTSRINGSLAIDPVITYAHTKWGF